MNAEMLATVALGMIALVMLLRPLWDVSSHATPLDFSEIELEETAEGQALLALRELEFDHATGKLSDSDYDELRQRYQVRAISLLEEGVAANAVPTCRTCGPRPEKDAVVCSSCGEALSLPRHCSACGPASPRSSAFCEQCGTRLQGGAS